VPNSKEVPDYQRQIESELERAITAMRAEMVHGEEYAKALTRVERLYELLDKEKPKTFSKDTILTVAANLIGIILILKHENVNVITSKALGFVLRPR
jgi:phage gp29-like protein